MIRFVLVDLQDIDSMVPVAPPFIKFSDAQAAADAILAFTGHRCVVFKSARLYRTHAVTHVEKSIPAPAGIRNRTASGIH
jgi:hypothetical protein